MIAIRRVFQDSWPVTIGKVAIVLAAYAVCMAVISLILLALALQRV